LAEDPKELILARLTKEEGEEDPKPTSSLYKMFKLQSQERVFLWRKFLGHSAFSTSTNSNIRGLQRTV
jgi:hypothetical protein